MNGKTLATRGRAWTAALLASSVVGTTIFTGSFARAEDTAGEERPRAADDDASRRVTVVEYKAPRPHAITDWQEGEPIPPGYHPVQRVRRGPIIAGAVTFGVVYLISVLIAAGGTDASNASGSSNPAAGLYIPVVGPFITMTQSSSAIANVFLVIDGAAQAGGAVLLLYGLTSQQTVLVRDDYGRPKLLPHPILFGSSGGGLGLSGTF